MNKNNSHFLDKQTLIALALVFMSWFLWERYMRTKYKPQLKPAEKIEEQKEIPVQKETKNEVAETIKEIFFDFEDNVKKVQFSSRGMGIKKVELKNHLDRKQKKIQFKMLSSHPLFEITKEGRPLFFHIEKAGEDKVQGTDASGTVQVLIHVKDYSFSYTVNIKNPPPSSLEIQLVTKPVEKTTGLLKSLIVGRTPGLSLFVKTSKEEKRFFSEGKKEEFNLSQMEILGLGGRYFGQAFFNESDLLPFLNFRGDEKFWRSKIIFNFPQTGNESLSLKYQTFFGPKSTDLLKKISPQMVSWVDFGFLSGLAKIILAFLKFAFLLTNNWGMSIILLTIFVRILLFPLNLSAYRSMKIMKKIQPEMKALQKKYKNDMKTRNEKTLELMRKNKARPFRSFLPIILQLPVFFSLYRVLGESFELYQAPFFGWIQDLSLKDPFYIMPVLMGLSMYFQQKITPTNMDPHQEKILRILPFIFALFMINLPSGLNLYILISTLFGLIQQYYFTKAK